MTRWAALLVCALAVGFILGSQVAQRPEVQQLAQAPPAPKPDKVTEADVELYIAVYGAMQADHGLTIDSALAGREVTLDQFRDLERRVQTDQHMVDRVRLALLAQAKARNSWLPPGSTAAPANTAEPAPEAN